MDKSQTRCASFGCPRFPFHPTWRPHLMLHRVPPAKDPDAQCINGKLILLKASQGHGREIFTLLIVQGKHEQIPFFSPTPTPPHHVSFPCLLPHLSPFSAGPWPWPLQSRSATPVQSHSCLQSVDPTYPSTNATLWFLKHVPQRASPTSSLNPQLLIKEFCCLRWNSSRIH